MLSLCLTVYIQYKIHELSSIGYLVMAEDGREGRLNQKEGRTTPKEFI